MAATTRKIRFPRDAAVKSTSYKAGDVVEFPQDLATAIVYHRKGVYADTAPADAADAAATPVEPKKK